MRTPNIKQRSRLLNAAVAALGLLLAYSASADCISFACTDVRITMLYTEANGDTYVQVSGNMANLNCTLDRSTYITLSAQNSARYKELYAGLLAYQLADRPMSIRINELSSGCTVKYIYATS